MRAYSGAHHHYRNLGPTDTLGRQILERAVKNRPEPVDNDWPAIPTAREQLPAPAQHIRIGNAADFLGIRKHVANRPHFKDLGYHFVALAPFAFEEFGFLLAHSENELRFYLLGGKP